MEYISLPHICCGLFIFVFLVFPTWLRMQWGEWQARKEQEEARASGRHEPTTILPWINPMTCMGAAACVRACPEHVLKILDGQAVVVSAASCVGHGVCVPVCPVDAVELVFGSETRGIDIPEVGGNFETNVKGLFVAGELSGMGLIANAIEQGAQAMEYVKEELEEHPDRWDVLIVGAGPAGIAAASIAHQLDLRYVVIEQEHFGGAIRHYPRQKLVFIRPVHFPGYGTVKVDQLRKEELIAVFEDVVDTMQLNIQIKERVEAIHPLPDGGFQVETPKGTLFAQRVILAIGRRGTPRTLGVGGEEQEKVAYWLKDPELYHYQHILVVGGGDSAVEAAMVLGEQEGNRVWLSYRKNNITRPKKKNQDKLRNAVAAGQVELLLESNVREIGVDRVVLEQRGEELVLPNDFVFVFAGGILPTKFLKAAGIKIKTHYGRRIEENDS